MAGDVSQSTYDDQSLTERRKAESQSSVEEFLRYDPELQCALVTHAGDIPHIEQNTQADFTELLDRYSVHNGVIEADLTAHKVNDPFGYQIAIEGINALNDPASELPNPCPDVPVAQTGRRTGPQVG